MQLMSADSCRTREIDGVRKVELGCIWGLLRTVVNLLYCLCMDLLEVGSLAKESRMFG